MKFPYHKDIYEPFAYGYLSALEKGKYSAMGEGLYEECALLPIYYDEDVKLFQCGRCGYPWGGTFAGFVSFSGLFFNAALFKEKKEKFPDYKEFFDAAEEALASLDTHNLICSSPYKTEEENILSDMYGFWGGFWAGHTVPDYGGLLSGGTESLRAKIRKYRNVNPASADFYDGLERVLDGFELIGQRIREKALHMAESASSEEEKNHLLAIARAMQTCPQNTPENFLAAAQFFWMFFSYDGYDSPGRLDQIFLPYWKKTPYNEAFAILEGIWIGFHKHRSWNVCISGSDEFGNDTTNEISFAMLDLVKKHRFETPNLTMRCHENTDPALIRAAAEALAVGCGVPALYNDRVVCKSLQENLGIPPKDAHNYAMNGCNQIDIQGKSHMGLEDGQVNLYKCLELCLHRGKCLMTNRKLGLDCGDPAECKTFEEFLLLFKKEVEYVTEICCRFSNISQKIHAEYAPNLWRSLMHQGCIEKGRDFKNGGPIYNHGQILTQGLADTVDSLAAIRYHVFEQKNFTMEQLIAALEKDFEGEEVMRQMLSEKPIRFGNGDADTDAIGKDIMEHFFQFLLTIPTYRGGRFSGGCSPFSEAAKCGSGTGAGANGRHKGDPLIADSIGATPGRDETGPTALLNSVLKLPHHLAGSGFILNIKFDKALFNTEEGLNNFIALWKTYFENGGQQMAVTVVSEEELRDALVHPENHRNLIVRIGGYCDYFVNLAPELQQSVLNRTSNRT